MKIQSTTNNFCNFKAGMSKKVLSEISHVDCSKIEKKLLEEKEKLLRELEKKCFIF